MKAKEISCKKARVDFVQDLIFPPQGGAVTHGDFGKEMFTNPDS